MLGENLLATARNVWLLNEWADMDYPQLHAALMDAAVDAAYELRAQVASGAEVPIELDEHGGQQEGPNFYSYKPLIGIFVERYAEQLGELESFQTATQEMVGVWGVDAYLIARGIARPPVDIHSRAELAVRIFLERLFEETPDFDVTEQRFEAIYAEVENSLARVESETVVVMPLVGLQLDTRTLAISRGVSLQVPETLIGNVPEMALRTATGELVDCVATLRWYPTETAAETPRKAVDAALRFLCALRLYLTDGSPGAGSMLWVRPAGEEWRAIPIPGTWTSHGQAFLSAYSVKEVKEFTEAVARRLPEEGRIAWVLKRWAISLDRQSPEDRLPDLMLACRALLEPEGSGSHKLAGRIAALCAEGDERLSLTRRVAELVAEEDLLIDGRTRLKSGLEPAITELNGYLHGILRDNLLGHIDDDLVTLADGILEGLSEQVYEISHTVQQKPVRKTIPLDKDELQRVLQLNGGEGEGLATAIQTESTAERESAVARNELRQSVSKRSKEWVMPDLTAPQFDLPEQPSKPPAWTQDLASELEAITGMGAAASTEEVELKEQIQARRVWQNESWLEDEVRAGSELEITDNEIWPFTNFA